MNIYKISQTEQTGYDTYDSAVVIAPSALVARDMNPSNGNRMREEDWKCCSRVWASSIERVEAEKIGTATSQKQQLVCASFNAG